MAASSKRFVPPLLLVCFVLSGGAALLYEVSWLRLLVLVFGTTGFAVATLLTAFMAGLALGSYLFGRVVDRWLRPVLLYGFLEVGLGAYALLVPGLFDGLVPLYRWVWTIFHPSFFIFSLLRFALAFLVLLVPTTLMGGTLPVLSRFFATTRQEVGFRVGLLYAFNTLGSVLGSFATGFFLLPAVGIRRTLLIGIATNALVGALALLVARYIETPAVPRAEAPAERRGSPRTDAWTRPVLLVFGLSGFLAMGYEVAWTRLLTLVLGSSTYSFTLMVTTFILGIALGSALLARAADRLASPVIAFGLLEYGIGLATFVGLLLAHRLPSLFLWLFQWTGGRSPLFVAGQVSLAGLVMFLPTLLLGATFPVVIRLVARDVTAIGQVVGRAYAANTIGAVLGAFTGGFVLIPRLGIQRTILVALVLNVVAGAALLGLAPGLTPRRRMQWAGGALLGLLLILAEVPPWDRLVMSSGVYREAPALLSLYDSPRNALRLLRNFDLLYYREGVTATVTVVERPILEDRRHVALAIDGKVDASTAQDMATQVLSAHLPLMLAPRLDRVLVIGWGSGVTAGSASLYPVKRLTAIEIEPAVVEGSRVFDDVNHRPLEDERLRLIIDDGRNYLLAAPDTFDVIISEPSNPWMSGPAKLFTREFFELGAAHLAPGGIFCQWLQLYALQPSSLRALIRTFQNVFPESYLVQTAEADLLLLGSRRPFILSVPSFRRRFAEPRVAEDLARVGVRSPEELVARFRLGSRGVAGLGGVGPLNTDDNGLIEFAAPKALYLQTIETNLAMIERGADGIAGYLSARDPEEEAEFLVGVGHALLELGRDDEARDALDRALTLAPSPAGYWLLGEALSRGRDDRGALEAWARALRLDPGHLPSLLGRARQLLAQGKFADARSELTRATRVAPQDRTAWTLTALAAHAEGRDAEAHRALARTGNLRPQEALEAVLLPYLAYKLEGGMRSDRGVGAAELAGFVRNLRQWRQTLHWVTPSLGSSVVDSLWALGERYFPRDQELRAIVEAEVLRPLTAFFTGLNAYLLGFYSEAIEILTPVEAEAGDSLPLASYYLGLAHLRSGHGALAVRALSRFLEAVSPERRRGPTYADARLRISQLGGRAAADRGRGGRATGQAQVVGTSAPVKSVALWNLLATKRVRGR